ncbi:MAG: hypothetical protein DMF65_09640 [Acidobacteria bacterium]|nr:MAG: hypothetical protein DMF65_09640 [Acidobacteriota bacterium]
MQRKWIVFAIALGLVGTAFGVSAQDSKERNKAAVEVYVQQNGPEGVPPNIEASGDSFVFVSTEMSFGGKVVKGAPYTAEAVTESVQTLADGNRIVHKTTAQVYRDSEGRTRRDQTIGAIGPYAAAGDPPQTYFINDPVAGVDYILEPRSKTARKLPHMEFSFKTESGEPEKGLVVERKLERTTTPPPSRASKEGAAKGGEARDFVFTTTAPPLPAAPGEPDVQFFARATAAETKTEKLDARSVEGVQAEGTRTTTTIPAGGIGNEQPIQIVNERWYSPELQVVVMTRHSDPRFGETTYRLTNIQRGEPASTLFQVPSDYTVKEVPGPGARRTMRVRRPEGTPPPEN